MTRVFGFSFPSGKRSDRVQTGRFLAHFRATDFAAPMVVTVWSSVDEFQALDMRLAARVLLPGTGSVMLSIPRMTTSKTINTIGGKPHKSNPTWNSWYI